MRQSPDTPPGSDERTRDAFAPWESGALDRPLEWRAALWRSRGREGAFASGEMRDRCSVAWESMCVPPFPARVRSSELIAASAGLERDTADSSSEDPPKTTMRKRAPDPESKNLNINIE